jgi:peptide/nickel transport system substrate-binding protein
MTRRDFVQRAMALGATTALATSMAGSALAATPKKGGTLRLGIGHGSTTDSLDPATFENLYMQTVGAACYNKLTEIGNTGELLPEAAESWDVSSDATTWTFKLRKGVEFHNGKTMDSADVVASIQHHLGEDSKSAAKGILEPVAELKADGKDTVVFTLKSGSADFPFIISDYHLGIMPSKDGKVDATSATRTTGKATERISTGPRCCRSSTRWHAPMH